MRFNRKRAMAFGKYTITAMLFEAAERKNNFVTINKREFAEMLDTQRLRPEHVDLVRSTAMDEGVVMADMGHAVVFFYFSDIEKTSESLSAERGRAVTDAFEKVYGSDAADEMWETNSYPS